MRRKIVKVLLAIAFCLASIGVFTACNNNASDSMKEIHNWVLRYNDNDHWFECTHCPSTKDDEEHTIEFSGECSVCKALIARPSRIDYEIIDGVAKVVHFGGRATHVRIAPTYKGIPVTEIGMQAFEGGELKSIEIPDSITTIGEYAFSGCRRLTDIEISDSVTRVGHGAFSDCRSLQFNHYENMNYLGNSENPYSVLIGPADREDSEFTIHPNIKAIAGGAFKDWFNNLTEITIPDGITCIEKWTFVGCQNLKAVKIPDNVTSIGEEAFFQCSSLTNIEIPDSVTSIGNRAFFNCIRLAKVKLPDSKLRIGNEAFANCDSLTSIEIPDSVISVGSHAFYGGALQFNHYENMQYLGNSETPYLVLMEAGDGENSEFTIHPDVKIIAGAAFSIRKNLTKIVIPNGVTCIGDGAFRYCSSLTSIIFEGASAQWNVILKGEKWNHEVPATEVFCCGDETTVRI